MTGRGSRPARRDSRPRWFGVAAPVGVAATTALGFATSAGPHEAVWFTPVALLLTVMSRSPGSPLFITPATAADPAVTSARLVLTRTGPAVLGAVAAFVLGALPFGVSVWSALQMAVVHLLVLAGIVLAHRRLRVHLDGALNDPRDVLVLAASGLIGAVALVALGGIPGGDLDGASVLSTADDMVVGLLVVVPLVSPTRPTLRTTHPRLVPLFAVLWAACVAVPVLMPAAAMMWLLLVPALWAGIWFGPRAAAVGVLGQSMLVEVLRRLPGVPERPVAGVLDLLVGVTVVLLFTLVVHRERSEVLGAELRRRADEEAVEAAVLDGVLKAADDGVVLIDDGRIMMSNPSARRLLGLTSTTLPFVTLLETEGFCDEAGATPLTELTAVLCDPPADQFAHVTLTTPDLIDAEGRRFDLAVRSVLLDHRRLALVVVSDQTLLHTRQKELGASAGGVAHDLKQPLAGVRRLIDLADDHLRNGDHAAGRYALTQAETATVRMRGMIDDYLAYTVATEGVLRLSAAPLRDIVDEVFADAEDVLEVEADVPHVVHVDRSLAQRLLVNLVAEVVGDGAARVRVVSTPADPGWVRVVVQNDGAVERPPDEQSIFGLVDEDEEGRGGPGMALCDAVVRRHGGRLDFPPEAEGGGVGFTLPLADAVVRS